MRDDVHDLNAGGVRGFVTGNRARSRAPPRRRLTDVAGGRSHAATRPLVEGAQESWYPWVGRAIRVAIGFGVLYVVTWVRLRRLRRPAASGHATDPGRRRRPVTRAKADEDLPAYMHPGFRDEVETRQPGLTSAQAERDELARGLQQAELELDRSKSLCPRAFVTTRGRPWSRSFRDVGHGRPSTHGARLVLNRIEVDRCSGSGSSGSPPPEPTAAGTRCCRSTHGILTFSARSCRLPATRRTVPAGTTGAHSELPSQTPARTAVRRSRIGEWWPGRPRPRGAAHTRPARPPRRWRGTTAPRLCRRARSCRSTGRAGRPSW